MHGDAPGKDGHLARLRRIEGQVRDLQRMIQDDQYPVDVVTRVAATTRALRAVALRLLDEHLAACLTQAAAAEDDIAEAKIREAGEAVARLIRS